MRSETRRPLRLVSVAALGLGSLLAGSSLVRGAEIGELVLDYGLVPFDPPRPAADFSLPQLGGGDLALSDLSGKWVILTFWASWCGPCRAEMPSLQALHESHAGKGVVVLGVTVDQQSPAAKAFVEEYQLTFPQVWDEKNEVGRVYQATAIPVSYLVDPRGRVVALSRGARDWTQLAPLMDALVEQVPPAVDGEAVYAEALDMPAVSDPPTAELRLSDPSPQAGQEFFLEIHLRWAGDLEEYMPQIPKVYLPEGVIQKGVTASTTSRQGDQVVVYRVTLQAEEPGSFALDPVELRYQPRFAMDVATTRVVGPTVTVAPRTVAGMAPRMFALVVGGVAVSAVATLAAGWWWQSRKSRDPSLVDDRFDPMWDRYQEARGLRLKGDGAGFALIMMELLRQLDDPRDDEDTHMARLEERLRFGGHVPTGSELDQMERKVGRALEKAQPNPEILAREALRLQDDEESS